MGEINGHPADPWSYPDEETDEAWLAERDEFQRVTQAEDDDYYNRPEPEDEDVDICDYDPGEIDD